MAEYQKNQELELVITALGNEGEGIGHTEDGYTVFVKDALPGDQIRTKLMKCKKQYAFGRLMEIVFPSVDRVEPRCPKARVCGGCQIQELSYEKQLAFKEDKVRNNLIRIGGIENPPMEPIIGMDEPWRYRNKAQFPVGRNKEGRIIAGFYAGRTHAIIPVEHNDCLLGREVNAQILNIVLSHMEQYDIEPYDEATGTGLVRHVLIRCGFTSRQIMVCLVLNGRKLPGEEALADRLMEIPGMTSIMVNVNMENTNVILGDQVRTVRGQSYITDSIGDVSFQISPLSFYQVNPVQTEKLYGKALEYAGLTGEETVWDMYCGIGTISLFLAKKAKKVYGVEIVPDAIEDARRNAKLNGIENAEFFVGKSEDVLPEQYEKHQIKADVIVVDPPRKGCDRAVLDTMLKMQPKRIVYVSCDSATLARDVKILTEGGYHLDRAVAVDQFCHSSHVETVVLLSKGAKGPVDLCSARTEVERRMVDSRKVKVDFSLEGMDLSEFKGKATYEQIKAYVLEETGLKVSSLYIAQIKKKCGLDVGENFNLPKSENARQPQCTPEKQDAIMQAFKHFGII